MKGQHQVVVRNNRVQFKLQIQRNITILRGDSATGKTTLIGMIADYEALGSESGASVSCDVPCTVLSGRNWEKDLECVQNSIVFIDEGNAFVHSKDFARAVDGSTNYFVIAVREALSMLPYSVDEILGLRNTNSARTKYPAIKRIYAQSFRIYGSTFNLGERPDAVVVEDSNAGYEFFAALCERNGIRCISAGGKAKVFSAVNDVEAEKVLVVADGAAFGPEMEKVYALCTKSQRKKIAIYLPESFEWLILESGLFNDREIAEALANPSAHIESSEFLSWERYFTALLTRKTEQSRYLRYSKGKLNPSYLEGGARRAIEAELPELGIGE